MLTVEEVKRRYDINMQSSLGFLDWDFPGRDINDLVDKIREMRDAILAVKPFMYEGIISDPETDYEKAAIQLWKVLEGTEEQKG